MRKFVLFDDNKKSRLEKQQLKAKIVTRKLSAKAPKNLEYFIF